MIIIHIVQADREFTVKFHIIILLTLPTVHNVQVVRANYAANIFPGPDQG